MRRKARILIANRPRLMRSLVATLIAKQSDMEVVGELYDEKDIVAAVDALRPDVLILGLDLPGRTPSVYSTLLTKWPGLRILGLGYERNASIYCWMDAEVRSRSIENSEQGLLEAIRGGVSDQVVRESPESERPN